MEKEGEKKAEEEEEEKRTKTGPEMINRLKVGLNSVVWFIQMFSEV